MKPTHALAKITRPQPLLERVAVARFPWGLLLLGIVLAALGAARLRRFDSQ